MSQSGEEVRYSPSNIFAFTRHMKQVLEENSFQAYIVYGAKGRGKSTYAIKAVAQLYHILHGMRYREAFEEALKSVGFTAFDILRLIEQGRNVIVWDDAGVWLSTYMWFDEQYRKYIEAFMDYWDVVRTDAAIIIFTTPTKYKLPPKIREDPSAIVVAVTKEGMRRGPDGRLWQIAKAEAAQNIESLYRESIVRATLWEDFFTVKLPDPIYQRYRVLRERYAELARKKLWEVAREIFGEEQYLAVEG